MLYGGISGRADCRSQQFVGQQRWRLFVGVPIALGRIALMVVVRIVADWNSIFDAGGVSKLCFID